MAPAVIDSDMVSTMVAPLEQALVGPPELSQLPPAAPKGAGEPFLDMMLSADGAHMGRTENGSWTLTSSLSASLDFFFQVVPSTPKARVQELLEGAWAEDPITALKLICQLRGVRGKGKSDKLGFYHAATWLHANHPKTLAANVQAIAEFGYWKDLLEVVLRGAEGNTVTDRRLEEQRLFNEKKKKAGDDWKKAKSSLWRELRRAKQPADAEPVLGPNSLPKGTGTLSEYREAKKLAQAARLLARYKSNDRFRSLHNAVADAFAEQLKQDLAALAAGAKRGVSLAAKWAPSLDSSYDRTTLLCEAIARRMFPKHLYYTADLADEHYAYRVRDRLRKEVLVPLRRHMSLPETFMSSNRWGELPYNRVPSVCMRLNSKHFLTHDPARFSEYLEQAKQGKKKLASGALLPHLVLKDALESEEQHQADVAELQWQSMVQDLQRKGKLTNCLAVCDVSGSMAGEPMEVCVALGLLLADISEAPWNGAVCTFSERPQIHKVQGSNLADRAGFVKSMDWGMNTNFQAVFDLILNRARATQLPQEKMIKRLYVFSDMEFDVASSRPYQTDYMEIERKFKEVSYSVPEIVFWNLRDSRSTPVIGSQPGVALVSGFSKNMLKLFLEEGGAIDPLKVMQQAITGPLYEKLRVVD